MCEIIYRGRSEIGRFQLASQTPFQTTYAKKPAVYRHSYFFPNTRFNHVPFPFAFMSATALAGARSGVGVAIGAHGSHCHLLLTSSIARRITSASVSPSLVACFTTHACWDAVSTICRWTPLVTVSPFLVANRANIHVYCGVVK
jgi:hypothetical protein